jgi:acetamidase/formamidase
LAKFDSGVESKLGVTLFFLESPHRVKKTVLLLFATEQAGDLKISEVVDQPKWVVSFHMPLAIFGASGLSGLRN